MINILHLTPWNLGGATSFVVNLAKTFEAAGVRYRIARFAKRTEKKKRQIGEYGVYYQNVTFDDCMKAGGKWLLASAPTDKEAAENAVLLVHRSKGAFVFHDPNEFGMYPHWDTADRSRSICIREAGLSTMTNGVFIPHPYVRVMENDFTPRKKHAVSIARISGVKNSLILLHANETLPKAKQVQMVGSLNRFWWNFSVAKKYPQFTAPEGGGFPRVQGAAVAACVGYDYMVDLTIFKNDGGGTQYSFLEAIDAGAVPVMTKDWCSYPGVARKLGFQVENAEELVALLKDKSPETAARVEKHRRQNYAYLTKVHDPVRVATQYVDYLGA